MHNQPALFPIEEPILYVRFFRIILGKIKYFKTLVTGHLVAALRGRVKLLYRYYTKLLTEGRKEIIQKKDQETEEDFYATAGIISPT